MEFLETLANDCNFNLSSPLFEELLELPEEHLRASLSDIHARCTQDYSTILLNDVYERYPRIVEASNYLRLYVPPVLLAFGTFGNIVSFIILAESMRRVGTYCYLTILSVMDLLVLFIGLLRMWLGNFTLDVQHRSDILCNIVNLLGYMCSDISVWLIVAVTTERFLAVSLPLRASRMCNVKIARYVIAVLVLSLFCLNIHFLWTVKLDPESNLCDASPSYKILVKQVWPWVDAAVYSMIPFVVILVLNVLIIRRISFAKRKRTQLQMHPFVPKTKRAIRRRTVTKYPNEHGRKLTCMLLAVSFCFLFTTLPMNVFTIVNALVGPGTDSAASKDSELFKYATFRLARTIVELLMYLNHSINFFLYCAMGQKFRRQCITMASNCAKCKADYLFKNVSRTYSMTSSFKLSGFQSSRRSTLVDLRGATVIDLRGVK